jgi:hypothetical protein
MPLSESEQEAALRRELHTRLEDSAAYLEAAMRVALADAALRDSEDPRIELEVDAYFYGITLCETEAEVVPDDWLRSVFPSDWAERVDAAACNESQLFEDVFFPFLADVWDRAGGTARFPEAVAFWHGFRQRYGLATRVWTSE